MDIDQGKAAVRFARSAVEAEASRSEVGKAPECPGFSDPRGAFVTLNTYPGGSLRGCIGYPYPVMSLAEAIEESARSACHDPRFPDLSPEETDGIVVEVTVLTAPEAIPSMPPDEIAESIRIGRDGLMLELAGCRGLFLPQVPVEQGWDVQEYLGFLSMKAGLPYGAWRDPRARLSRFEGEIFSETSPRGDVVRRDAE